MNQFLSEKGVQTPFILTKEECIRFWQNLDNTDKVNENRPENYAKKGGDRIRFLHDFWRPQVDFQCSILEMGSNCGANLIQLNHLGYERLSGVEVNPHAIKQMDFSFPRLREKIPIVVGSIEKVIREMADDAVDLIFTMGVSMHIHPKDNSVFTEMARVAKKYICTIEPEPSNSNYVFARNYRRIFENSGAVQIKSVLFRPEKFPDYKGEKSFFTFRLFRLF